MYTSSTEVLRNLVSNGGGSEVNRHISKGGNFKGSFPGKRFKVRWGGADFVGRATRAEIVIDGHGGNDEERWLQIDLDEFRCKESWLGATGRCNSIPFLTSHFELDLQRKVQTDA